MIKRIRDFIAQRSALNLEQKDSTNQQITPSVEQKSDVSVEEQADKPKQVIKLEIPILKPIGIIGILFTLFTIVFNNPEKIQSWINIIKSFIPKTEIVPYSCEVYKEVKRDGKSKTIDSVKVEFDVVKKLEGLIGCDPILGGIDATIPLDTNDNSPKLMLIVDKSYGDLTLDEFYLSQLKEAEKWSSKKITDKDKQPDFILKNYKAYKLVYAQDKIKRKDIGFLYKNKIYIIRYEATISDFEKHKKKFKKIVNSLKFTNK